MSTHVLLTDDEKATIRRMREEGMSIPQIRTKTGRSHTAIRHAIGMNSGEKLPPAKAASKQRMARVAELRSQGYSYVEIGTMLHISKQTAAYYGAKAQRVGQAVPVLSRKRRIAPIVLGAETVADTDQRRMSTAIDLLWAHLPFDQKLRAIEALKEIS